MREIDPYSIAPGRPIGLGWFSPDCFLPGTLVLAHRGLTPIEGIAVGDLVLTHQNRWRRVESTHTHEAPETVEVRGYGHPGLVTTPSHKFYSKRITTRYPGARKPNGKREGLKRTLIENPYWPEAEDMADRLWATPSNVPPTSMPIPEDTDLSDDFFYFVGRWIGDGSTTRIGAKKAGSERTTSGDIDICTGNRDLEAMKAHFAQYPLKDGNGDIVEPRVKVATTAAHLVWGKHGLADWLANNFGRSCETKCLPVWCLSLPRRWRQALLDGYVDADGHEGIRTQTVTVSKALAIGMRLLVVSLGHAVSLYFNAARVHTIEGRVVQGRDSYTIAWRADNEYITTIADGRHTFYPVREVTPFGPQIVVSLQVEEDESFVADGIVVHNCTYFSAARGGKPFRDRNLARRIRGLPWTVTRWAKARRPRVIMLENVTELKGWGPLLEDGTPCPKRRGTTFRRWHRQFENMGYQVDMREMVCSDYGARTSRKRLFVIMRCDGQEIVFPEPTHGTFAGALPYGTAADCIDWSIPCPSIFERDRELVEATMRRLARGLKRYVIEDPNPFILNFRGTSATHINASATSLREPLRSISSGGNHQALVVPFLTEHANASGQRNFSADEPLRTLCANVKGGHFALVAAFLARNYGGHENDGSSLRIPMHTITTKDHHSLVYAFLQKYYGTDQNPRLDQPLGTLTTKDRFALVKVTVDGQTYSVADIGMRMLVPRELARAHTFRDSYILDPIHEGRRLSKADQVWMLGNSVPPVMSEALVRANYMDQLQEEAA